jgi:hypothetical protein
VEKRCLREWITVRQSTSEYRSTNGINIYICILSCMQMLRTRLFYLTIGVCTTEICDKSDFIYHSMKVIGLP